MKQYKLVIFDMDGTMYFQPPFRRRMALRLFGFYLLRPGKWKELLILARYRKVREHFDRSRVDGLEAAVLEKTAARTGVAPEIVDKVVKRWIHEEPLGLLPRYRDEQAARLLKELKARGVITAVYSDYPVGDKLHVLGLKPDCFFSGNDPEINCLKPNPAGIHYIMRHFQVLPEETLMIGDRMEKDGLAARNAGADYVILGKGRRKRARQYRELCLRAIVSAPV